MSYGEIVTRSICSLNVEVNYQKIVIIFGVHDHGLGADGGNITQVNNFTPFLPKQNLGRGGQFCQSLPHLEF